MTPLIDRALALWGISGARVTFVAGRENQVYRVRSGAGDFALRIKRPGYRSEAELVSELNWLDAMHRAGLSVPRPHPALDGRLLLQVGGKFVDMVGWLHGAPLDQTDVAPKAFERLGIEMARLHTACDDWALPADFARCHWDVDGLVGESPVWGRFWENPTLDADTCALFKRFRARAQANLQAGQDALDYGLIHADLLAENVLFDGPTVRLLDFDDGGFGFRLFDLATTLLRSTTAPNSPDLRVALVQGYQTERALSIRHLDLFLALRAMTYVGWIVPRMSEAGSADRNQRLIARAKRQASAYLHGSD